MLWVPLKQPHRRITQKAGSWRHLGTFYKLMSPGYPLPVIAIIFPWKVLPVVFFRFNFTSMSIMKHEPSSDVKFYTTMDPKICVFQFANNLKHYLETENDIVFPAHKYLKYVQYSN